VRGCKRINKISPEKINARVVFFIDLTLIWGEMKTKDSYSQQLIICVMLVCRYLDSYEKQYFLGEEEEDESGLYYDEEDSRVRNNFSPVLWIQIIFHRIRIRFLKNTWTRIRLPVPVLL
jgi:hypothetical protein